MTAKTNNGKNKQRQETSNGKKQATARNKQRQETSNGKNKQRQEQATARTRTEADPLRG